MPQLLDIQRTENNNNNNNNDKKTHTIEEIWSSVQPDINWNCILH